MMHSCVARARRRATRARDRPSGRATHEDEAIEYGVARDRRDELAQAVLRAHAAQRALREQEPLAVDFEVPLLDFRGLALLLPRSALELAARVRAVPRALDDLRRVLAMGDAASVALAMATPATTSFQCEFELPRDLPCTPSSESGGSGPSPDMIRCCWGGQASSSNCLPSQTMRVEKW